MPTHYCARNSVYREPMMVTIVLICVKSSVNYKTIMLCKKPQHTRNIVVQLTTSQPTLTHSILRGICVSRVQSLARVNSYSLTVQSNGFCACITVSGQQNRKLQSSHFPQVFLPQTTVYIFYKYCLHHFQESLFINRGKLPSVC